MADEKDPIYTYYEDMQVYINDVINSSSFVNEAKMEKPKAPEKPKNLNEDLTSIYTKKVSEALVNKETKVMDYYNAVREAEKIFKLKYSIENLYKDRGFLIQGVI